MKILPKMVSSGGIFAHGPLKAKPGFDWNLVKWGGPKHYRRRNCSYCGKLFSEQDDADSLMLWKDNGAAAEFCEQCQRDWFGIAP